jgi:glycosyltransferase involved in cell wall biosynthesis
MADFRAKAPMKSDPTVSVIMPFHNTPPAFLREAIDSILQQTYSNWQLLLVDDGSAGECVTVARDYAARYPGQVCYLEHDGRHNQGMSASRNLGIAHATGQYLAFLDADDVWLPHTIIELVATIEGQPTAAMVYGNTEYWYSWTGREADRRRDRQPELGVEPDTLVKPPALVPRFLTGSAAVPCPCSLMIRRHVVETLGGFEAAFRNLYEDQVFYVKVCLHAPVYVAARTWGRYRQHAGMSTSAALNSDEAIRARLIFLRWVESYLREHGIQAAEVWHHLRQQLWLYGHGDQRSNGRRIRKWLLRLQRQVLPPRMQEWLWLRGAFDE